MPPRRIAVSGSAGIGKSTLCQCLASATGYPLIPDVIDTVLQERGNSGWGGEGAREEAVGIRLEALERKIEQERSRDTFISDKSVLDYLGHWDLNTSADASAEDSRQFEKAVAEHVGNYDLILLLLWGRRPIEEIGRRRADPVHQLRVHSAITRRMLQFRAPFTVFDQYSTDPATYSLENLTCLEQSDGGKRQIGLFGGTFDPPTNGHLKCALESLQLVDEVWFCPNPDNPSRSRRHLSIEYRAHMLDVMTSEHDDLRLYLRDANPNMADSAGTKPRSRLLREVRCKFPNLVFWVIIGTDKLMTPAYLIPDPEVRRTGHLVFPRPDEPTPETMARLDLWVIMHPVGPESSSETKLRLACGSNPSAMLPEAMAEFIKTQGLYTAQNPEAQQEDGQG